MSEERCHKKRNAMSPPEQERIWLSLSLPQHRNEPCAAAQLHAVRYTAPLSTETGNSQEGSRPLASLFAEKINPTASEDRRRWDCCCENCNLLLLLKNKSCFST